VETGDGRPDGLRASPWLKAFGPTYLDSAFHAARQADSDALLVYNDYGLDTADPWSIARQAAVLNLLDGLAARGVPCGALGLQAHLKVGADFQEERFRAFLAEVAGRGLRILITELDVADSGMGDPGRRDRAVADLAGRYLAVAFDQPQTLGLVTWGLSDRYTWLAKGPWAQGADFLRPRPLPLDGELQRKPLWHAIGRAFDAAPARSAG
jgi:endo-1,4-beta-xylanase